MAESRASWRGFLKLSLVSCPVRVMPAVTQSNRVRFHNIIRGTEQRIEMRPHDSVTGDELEREELVRGYEVEKDRFVTVDDKELGALAIESSRTLDLDKFVEPGAIDRAYYDDSYYLAPDGAVADETFRVVREAMQREEKIGIGRFVIANRERAVALEPLEKGFVMTTLRAAAEVRSPDEVWDDISERAPGAKAIELAEDIIDKMSGDFRPELMEDRFEAALRKLVDAKVKGRKPAAPKPVEAAPVIDLMAALKKSLRQGGKADRAAAGNKPRRMQQNRQKKRA
jgi:DNA end-binding protein Ku